MLKIIKRKKKSVIFSKKSLISGSNKRLFRMKRASAFGETEVLYFFAKFPLATCSLHVRYMFATCSLHVRYMFATCSLHVRFMFATCSLYLIHVHFMFSIFNFELATSANPLNNFSNYNK